MGLNETGFERRTYEDIISDKIDKAIQLFGDDIDTSEQTPLGKFIRINAYDQANAEEEIEALYYSIFPHTATGASLDRLCPFVGITRLPATPARYSVKLTGTAGTEIPLGFLVSTESEITYYNINSATIGESGTATITVECETAGIIGNVTASEINTIVNPISDVEIDTVTVVNLGTDVESDVSLRTRFEQASTGMGSCNESAIRAALLRVTDVTSASVIVNDTDETDSDGRPPHSFECYVAGGANRNQEIAQAIFDKKPIGIRTHGTESVDIVDESGVTRTIKFSHVQGIQIYVKATIYTDTKFEGTDGMAQIKSNIKDKIDNLSVGNNVIRSSLYDCIHAVTGVVDVSYLALSTNGTTWSESNITISPYQKAYCNTVTVSEGT